MEGFAEDGGLAFGCHSLDLVGPILKERGPGA